MEILAEILWPSKLPTASEYGSYVSKGLSFTKFSGSVTIPLSIGVYTGFMPLKLKRSKIHSAYLG